MLDNCHTGRHTSSCMQQHVTRGGVNDSKASHAQRSGLSRFHHRRKASEQVKPFCFEGGVSITLTEYLNNRRSIALSKAEALAIGIDWPLKSGWPRRHANVEIGDELLITLKRIRSASLSVKRKLCKKVKKQKPQPSKSIWKPSKSKSFVASDDFLSSYEWRRIRLVVLKRDGAKCACCGATPATGAVMNVDHIKPRKIYPELALDPNNLQVLCHECNHGKGNWDMTDFRHGDEDIVLGALDRISK